MFSNKREALHRNRKKLHQNLALDVWLMVTEMQSLLLSLQRDDVQGYERSIKRIDEIKARVLKEHVV